MFTQIPRPLLGHAMRGHRCLSHPRVETPLSCRRRTPGTGPQVIHRWQGGKAFLLARGAGGRRRAGAKDAEELMSRSGFLNGETVKRIHSHWLRGWSKSVIGGSSGKRFFWDSGAGHGDIIPALQRRVCLGLDVRRLGSGTKMVGRGWGSGELQSGVKETSIPGVAATPYSSWIDIGVNSDYAEPC